MVGSRESEGRGNLLCIDSRYFRLLRSFHSFTMTFVFFSVIVMRSLRQRSNLPSKWDCFTLSVHSQWQCFLIIIFWYKIPESWFQNQDPRNLYKYKFLEIIKYNYISATECRWQQNKEIPVICRVKRILYLKIYYL